MEEDFKPSGCDQASELIAFLYGELSDGDAQIFQSHMRGCRSCRLELASFSDIRSSVVAWRDESLGRISPARAELVAVSDHKRATPSAIAAVREFFNLSPVWLKGAVAFATLVFCLMAGLALARLQNNQPPPLAVNPPRQEPVALTEKQMNALVEQRVKDELQRLKNSTEQSPAADVTDVSPNRFVAPRNSARNLQVATNSPARRPLSKVEREQLAADLRLVAVNNDTELDLLDDRINK